MSNKVKIVSIVTYLIYAIFWDSLMFGGCSYVVFWMHRSAWWFLLAIILSACCLKPKHWRSLFEKVSYEDKDDD